MIVCGLTGGIGSGKSTVSALLAERGAVIVDADAIVRELQQPGMPLLDVLAERFGSAIVDVDGVLDRSALAAVAFVDAESVADLNAIVHPAVHTEINRRLADHAATDAVVVLDIPLLEERGRYGMQAVVVVDADPVVAVARLVEQRGMDRTDAERRFAAQLSRKDRRALADRVIDNSGDRDALDSQVDEVWAWMRALKPRSDERSSDLGPQGG
ncbi:hypothetical protein BH24ACT5_BH24ACT5_27910 [soil metagenome]